MEYPMRRLNLLTAGLVAAVLATPVMAQEATQEPGPMAQNYPDADYLIGGYGHRFTPGPRYYYCHNRYVGPGPAGWAVGPAAIGTAPFGYGSYAYYDGPDY
jgi:hypothetical protein